MKKPRASARPRVAILLAAMTAASVAVISIQNASAADGSWNVNLAGNWATAGSWLSSVIPGATSDDANTDTATFGFTLTTGRTVTVDANRSIKFIDFSNTSAFGYTLATGSLLLNNGGAITSSGSTGAHTDTISAALQLRGDGGSYTFGANSSLSTRLLTISGGITGVSTGSNVTTLTLNGVNTGLNTVSGIIGDGAGGGKVAVVKDGAGTWRLSGVNTYTGATSVQAGTLTVGNASALSTTSGVALSSGARIDVTATNTNLSKLAVANGGSGIVAGSFLRYSADQQTAGVSNGPGTIYGTVELNSGNVRPNYTMDFGNGSKVINLVTVGNFTPTSITLSGDTTFEASASMTLTVQSPISASTSGTKTLTLTGAGAGLLNGVVTSGSGSIALVKEGAGSWTLAASNAVPQLTGGVIINEGSLALFRSSSTGPNTVTTALVPSILLGDSTPSNTKSATMVINGTNAASPQIDSPITVRAGSSGALIITRNGTTSPISIGGGITLNNNLTLDGSSGSTAGIIIATVGISGAGNLTTENTITFNAANTYTGSTTVNSGTLTLGAANRIADVSNLILAGGTFATGGFSETLGTLTVSISSIIDLGSGASALVFADSSGSTWGGSVGLSFTNFDTGVDSIRFGTTSDGLTSTQLAQITLNGLAASIDGNGFLTTTAIPEPSTYAVFAGAGCLVLAIRRRMKTRKAIIG